MIMSTKSTPGGVGGGGVVSVVVTVVVGGAHLGNDTGSCTFIDSSSGTPIISVSARASRRDTPSRVCFLGWFNDHVLLSNINSLVKNLAGWLWVRELSVEQ